MIFSFSPGLELLLELGQLLPEAGDLVPVHPRPGLQLPAPRPLQLQLLKCLLQPHRHVATLLLQLHDLC